MPEQLLLLKVASLQPFNLSAFSQPSHGAPEGAGGFRCGTKSLEQLLGARFPTQLLDLLFFLLQDAQALHQPHDKVKATIT